MELTQSNTIKTLAVLLLLTAITQPIYTALYVGAPDINRQFIWGTEGLLFLLIAPFAGSALVMTGRYTLGFAAIASSAVLNVVQVSAGFTLFGPFTAAAAANPDFGGIASAIVAMSFFIYNAAKVLLGIAAVVFGIAVKNGGNTLLGSAAALVGAVAIVANTIVMMFGLGGFLPSPIAGGSGVLATLLLAICLFSINSKISQSDQT